jgi:hypothetical protein
MTAAASLDELNPPPDRRPLWLAGILFAALSVGAGAASSGFIEADACTHYLFSRFCLKEHHLLTNVWGRPFCTLIYAVPAVVGGRIGVRIFSAIIALAVGWICHVIARRQGYRHPALAMIFLLGQPMVFLHSFSELTELPFVLLLAIALWAYQGRRFALMAVVVGLMPTARPEGFGFIAMAAVALLLHGRWFWTPLLVLPLAAWSWIGWWQFGMNPQQRWWQWLPSQWPYAGESLYGRGYLLHFVGFLPGIVGPFFFPAVLVGWWLTLRWEGLMRFFTDHRYRVEFVVAVVPVFIVAVHSYLRWRGKMASSGEFRYMMVAAPMWALLAARGWEFVFDHFRWRPVYRAAGVACLAAALGNQLWQIVPFQLGKEGMRSEEVTAWIESQRDLRQRYPKLVATPRDIYYFMDLSPTDLGRTVPWHVDTVKRARDDGRLRGVMLVWDPIYGLYNSDAARSVSAAEIEEAGWVPVKIFDRQPGPPPDDSHLTKVARKIHNDDLKAWVVFLSPFDRVGNPTPRVGAVTVPEDVRKLRPATQAAR